MLTLRKSHERGHMNHGWLDTYHTFSFASYYDPKHQGFRSLRVLNDDRVQGGAGFGTHPHRDFEIISYVVDGALAHRDSMGNGSVIRSGDVQRMTAGTGVTHSEYNHSAADAVRFLQIWLKPNQIGLRPGYEQKQFTNEEKRDRLRLIVSLDGRDGSLKVNQDVSLYASVLSAGKRVEHRIAAGRHAWLQVVNGNITANGAALGRGDGASLSDERLLTIEATSDAEFLLFDLA